MIECKGELQGRVPAIRGGRARAVLDGAAVAFTVTAAGRFRGASERPFAVVRPGGAGPAPADTRPVRCSCARGRRPELHASGGCGAGGPRCAVFADGTDGNGSFRFRCVRVAGRAATPVDACRAGPEPRVMRRPKPPADRVFVAGRPTRRPKPAVPVCPGTPLAACTSHGRLITRTPVARAKTQAGQRGRGVVCAQTAERRPCGRVPGEQILRSALVRSTARSQSGHLS